MHHLSGKNQSLRLVCTLPSSLVLSDLVSFWSQKMTSNATKRMLMVGTRIQEEADDGVETNPTVASAVAGTSEFGFLKNVCPEKAPWQCCLASSRGKENGSHETEQQKQKE